MRQLNRETIQNTQYLIMNASKRSPEDSSMLSKLITLEDNDTKLKVMKEILSFETHISSYPSDYVKKGSILLFLTCIVNTFMQYE